MVATPPSVTNYQVGGITVVVAGQDLGNIVSFGIDPTGLELLEHITARSGARKTDKKVVTKKSLVFNVTLDEHAKETYAQYIMGTLTGSTVNALLNPLAEGNCVITYKNESATIWTYSHSKVVVSPSGAMDFGTFDDWVDFPIAIEALEDSAVPTAPHGTFTFT